MNYKKVFNKILFPLGFLAVFVLIETHMLDTPIKGLSYFLNISSNSLKNTLLISSFLFFGLFAALFVFRFFGHKLNEVKNNDVDNKKLFNGDFEDKELNRLIKFIHNKITNLKNKPFVKKDIECSLIIEQIESEYLATIHTAYMNIPISKRGNINIKDSPYELAIRQINLIILCLDKIEDKINVIDFNKLEVTEMDLKEKVISL